MRGAHILFLAAMLSGCVQTPAGDPGGTDPSAEAEGNIIPWGITDCRFIIAVVRFDPALAEGMLADGFTLIEGDGLPLPAEVEPLSRASLGVEAFDCASGAGLNGTVSPLAYGSFYFNVRPPDELSAGDDAGHYYKLSVLVPDAPRRAWFDGAGADVTGGSVSVTDTAIGRDASMQMDAVGAVRITSLQTEARPGFGGFVFREYTPADEGLVIWNAVAESPATFVGRGLLEVPEGSVPARLMGGTSAVLDIFGGTYTFTNATVALP